MGNNTSTLPDAVIDDSPILTTQDWSLHHAESADNGPLSVFIGQKSSQDSSLSALAKGLKQYRHPSILKYYAWAPNGNQVYLFTEKVCPISLVRSQQNPYSTGLGIFQICQAVKFLHQTGGVTHGNLIENSIFVTPAGEWRLAGLDSVTSITQTLPGSLQRDSEMLRFTDRESVEFCEYAKSNLLLPDLSRRPNILQVLEHPYFQQQYIQIAQFLKDLTLKTEKEKEEFFTELGDRLYRIPQQVLGQHFAKPLLSRYVMMDLTARSLADIVPILGPEKVIGKNNSRVFSDGSPSRRINKDNQSINISWKPQQQVSGIHTLGDHYGGGKAQHGAAAFTRIPPIGAENEEEEEGDGLGGSASNLEEWDNWEDDPVLSDRDDLRASPYSPTFHSANNIPSSHHLAVTDNTKFTSTIIQEDNNSISTITTKVKEVDIHSLDVKMAPPSAPIKNKMAAASQQRGNSTEDEVDFFADMTPDIPTNGLDLEKIQQQINNKKMEKFAAAPVDIASEGEGWGEEDDW